MGIYVLIPDMVIASIKLPNRQIPKRNDRCIIVCVRSVTCYHNAPVLHYIYASNVWELAINATGIYIATIAKGPVNNAICIKTDDSVFAYFNNTMGDAIHNAMDITVFLDQF